MSYGDNLVGTVLDGRYQLIQRIGEGGMGVVYKGQQLADGQIVAIKVLNSHMAKDPNWVQRFYNEAKATSQLQHANTIRMREFGQTPSGVLYLSMEFLDGQSLREAIRTSAPMPPVRVLSILSQCCASLAEAHSLSIVHRDIKPDNIFLLPRPHPDFVKVLDFSVAKLLADHGFRTQAGMVFGTPEYMSPEQGRSRPLDARSDLYGLGTVAFEMLTGQVPFSDPQNPMAVLQAHMTMPVPNLPSSIPQPVAQLIHRCMAKEPGQRYSSAAELKQHCDGIATQLGGRPPPAAQSHPASGQNHGQGRGGGYPTPNPAQAQRAGFNVAAAQRTMIASEPAGGRPPAAHGSGGPPPAAKTIMAGDADMVARLRGSGPPPAQGGPPPAAPPQAGASRTAGAPPHAKPQGFARPANAVAKTVVAGDIGNIFGPGGPPAIGGTPPSMPPTQPPAAGGAKKTVMLNPSEGVVSFNQGHSSAAVPVGAAAQMGADSVSPGFWILCLSIGLTVGIGAYFLVVAIAGGS